MGKILLNLLLLMGLIWPVQAHSITSKTKKIIDRFASKASMIGDQAQAYLEEHSENTYESITYGQLVKAGYLPESYCETPPARNGEGVITCGGNPTGLHTANIQKPPLIRAKNKRALAFILPYKDLSPSEWNYFYKQGKKTSLMPRMIFKNNKLLAVYVRYLLPPSSPQASV